MTTSVQIENRGPDTIIVRVEWNGLDRERAMKAGDREVFYVYRAGQKLRIREAD